MKKLLNFVLIMFSVMAMSATCEGAEFFLEDFLGENPEENVGENGSSNDSIGASNDSIGASNDSIGGGENYDGNDSIDTPNVGDTIKRLVRYVCENKEYTFAYDSTGRLENVMEINNDSLNYSSESYSYVWSRNRVENVKEEYSYYLRDGLIKNRKGGGSDDLLSIYYNFHNNQLKSITRRSEDGTIRFSFTWDGNNVTQLELTQNIKDDETDQRTYTFTYSGREYGRGFTSIWENPINEGLKDYLIMAHPELLNLQNWTELPSKMVCEREYNGENSTTTFRFFYKYHNDGYIKRITVMEHTSDSSGHTNHRNYHNELYWE